MHMQSELVPIIAYKLIFVMKYNEHHISLITACPNVTKILISWECFMTVSSQSDGDTYRSIYSLTIVYGSTTNTNHIIPHT
jgi:hypothetical protein